ncbi:MAG: tetratricopeptide repeat protein [Candidatus Aminicenantes bacterium]|nr:tetratricopeptide repeat protein [Candidatus Aminicenantes bacterium]
MIKRQICFILAAIPLVIWITGCSSSLTNDQLRFGIEAAKLDLWDEAIFRWKKTLQSSPDSTAAYNNLAVAYEKKGLWEEAKEAYETALKLRPEDKHINSNYKQFLMRYEARKDEIFKKE